MGPRPGALGPWIVLPRPQPGARLRLFCFPYAGGGASVFRSWPDGLPGAVEVCAVQLPGREGRLAETPFSDAGPLTAALHRALRPHLDRPFAFFGHSNGAMMAFELARALRRSGGPMPVHLFASGRAAPHVPFAEPPIHALPEPEFLHEVRRLSGTPDELFEHPELVELLLPLLRADFALAETYGCTDEPPLDVPISAFGGVYDAEVPFESVAAWRDQTTGAFRQRMFPGGHFFLTNARDELLREVAAELDAALSAGAGAD
jgi:medium-chain acyl-[acyl-carrier-protein] hydrolase